jgi:HAD superfamily hydrolase (TIGR01484 family)
MNLGMTVRMASMRAVAEIQGHEMQGIRGVLFDIDDTFTLQGKVIPEAFTALWELHGKGLILVPITGRPAGWCDHIARMWPVDGVVGENGAFFYYYSTHDRRLMRTYLFEPEAAREKRDALEAIGQEVLRRVPRAAIAADQHFRLFDLAVDFAEDVQQLSADEIQEICRVFDEHHATCRVSSIHVNGWFGDYNKLFMTKRFLLDRFGLGWENAKHQFIFMGDSPNDEPMFEAFPFSVGVANIRGFLPQMKTHPAFVTEAEGGKGFAEMARIILNLKA